MTSLPRSCRHRLQRTIRRSVETRGTGFFTGTDVTVRFHPAPDAHGVVFRRIDLPGRPLVPARLEHALDEERRTVLASGTARVELVEHVLAALAGLQVDNCLVEIDGPELPGGDGSALLFVEALDRAGAVEQGTPRELLVVDRPLEIRAPDGRSRIAARPAGCDALVVDYRLDYGADSPVPPQRLAVEIVPGAFTNELAYARTFVLEAEVAALRDRGFGLRVSPADLLVFGPQGPIGNKVRIADECVRHKILDCLGDFALLGCDVHGHFAAERSGHRLNREIARLVRSACAPAAAPDRDASPARRAA